MTEPTKSQPIAAWKEGDLVSGFASLAQKERRQDRNGNDYVDLVLVDASGMIRGKVWADSEALDGEYEAGSFVAIKGRVARFRDQLQLRVEKCREATEADRAYGFDEASLVPTTREDIDALWRRTQDILSGEVARPELRQVAAHALALHEEALRAHPAAKAIHHAYRGGLLEHVVSMLELALLVCSHYRDLDRDLVLLGVLFHDLGKIRELGAVPGSEYTYEGKLIGHVVIGRDLLRESCAAIGEVTPELQMQLEHLVLSHQGRLEFGTPVEPMTAEALTLHFIDDLDSKLNQLQTARRQGGGFQYLRGFGRYLYTGDTEATGDGEDADVADPDDQGRLDLG